ncbi:hypothetical protein EU534_02075 [Candidatus Heimdallarchaeota archaeon]|nr:MAG: hypothetical protein EU534_02075 [Candidatus Heimdallarchaeota archaeon]
MTEVIRGENNKLKKELISSLIDIEISTKEKFLESLDRQEEKVQECIDELAETLQEHIRRDILIQAVAQFENLQLLLIVKKLNSNKHFTRNQIAVNFLAILDNLLASVYEKLTPNHFDMLRDNIEGLTFGRSFSYNLMKKKQIELIQKGYISKIRKLGYTLKLKDQYCQIINHMMAIYPQHHEKLSEMEIIGYELVHSKSVPKLEVTKSAAVVVGSLITKYFKKKDEQDLLWKYLEGITDEQEAKIKRKVYRFKSNLKKEDENSSLFSYSL